MGSGAQTLTLSEILEQQVNLVRIDDVIEYTQVTVRIKGRGLASRGVLPGERIGTKRQYRIAAGQLLVSKIDARNGAFGIVPPGLDGAVVTQDFPVFTIDSEKCVPEFVGLIVSQPSFWDECFFASKGSTNRVRLNIEEFLSLEVNLPPYEEQEQIVEAIAALEGALAALHREVVSGQDLLRSMREELIAEASSETITLGDVLAGIDAGKSPKCEERAPTDEERGVLRVSAIRPGQFRPAEAKVVGGDVHFPARAEVGVGDVLINRASGSLSLVGSVCRVREDPGTRFLSDKTLRLRLDEAKAESDYLVEAMATVAARAQIEFAASGSSGQKNISQRDISEFELPLPALDIKKTIVSRLAAIRQAIDVAEVQIGALEHLRASLVDALLAGEKRVVRRNSRSEPTPSGALEP